MAGSHGGVLRGVVVFSRIDRILLGAVGPAKPPPPSTEFSHTCVVFHVRITGEKRGVADLLLGRTERAARAAELQLCAQAR